MKAEQLTPTPSPRFHNVISPVSASPSPKPERNGTKLSELEELMISTLREAVNAAVLPMREDLHKSYMAERVLTSECRMLRAWTDDLVNALIANDIDVPISAESQYPGTPSISSLDGDTISRS